MRGLSDLVAKRLIRLIGVKNRSGNWGHAGRPGLRGGSAPRSSSVTPAIAQSSPYTRKAKAAKTTRPTKEQLEAEDKTLDDFLNSDVTFFARAFVTRRYLKAYSYKRKHVVREGDKDFVLTDAVDFGGVTWHYNSAQSTTSNVVDSMIEWAQVKKRIPKRLASMLNHVSFIAEPDPGEAFWAKQFNMPDLQAHASADIQKRQIIVWRGLSLHAREYVHELGHFIRSTMSTAAKTDYFKIIQAGDEAPPTDYAQASEAEDFCEALRAVFNPDVQTKPVPKREAFIRKMFEETR